MSVSASIMIAVFFCSTQFSRLIHERRRRLELLQRRNRRLIIPNCASCAQLVHRRHCLPSRTPLVRKDPKLPPTQVPRRQSQSIHQRQAPATSSTLELFFIDSLGSRIMPTGFSQSTRTQLICYINHQKQPLILIAK